MKNILDVIFREPKQEPNLQHRSASEKKGVATFYGSNKPGKKIIEPENISTPSFDDYTNDGDFSAITYIVDRDRVDGVIPALARNGLTGCGGANFPVANKWKAALGSDGPRYLIVNAQEGEMHTFKDYALMMKYPNIIAEGAAIAALALGAEEVIIAINSSYIECTKRIKEAVFKISTELRSVRHITFRVMNGPKPDLYICGEETALIEYLENRRGEPQLKPPYPFESGYKGQPTVIQNVETIAWVPLLLHKTKLFTDNGHLKLVNICGAVNAPGIYEVIIGMTLSELADVAGGLKSGVSLQAIEVGGAAGGLLPPNAMNVALDHQEMHKWGAMVGTGSVNFIDQETSLVEIVLDAMNFFREESCGRCTPCRVGTHELVRMASIIENRALDDSEVEWFNGVTETMQMTSTCGLGKGASGIFVSLLRYWNLTDGTATLKSTYK